MNSQRWIEVTGEDVEQAITSGLEQLGVGPTEVVVEVLEEPSRGVFGLGSRPARVRLQLLVTPASAAPEPQPPQRSEQPPPAPVAPADIDVDDDDSDDYVDEMADIYEGPLDEDAEVGKVVLAELLEKMEVRARIEVRRGSDAQDENNPWLLDISSPSSDLSGLIGRRGETLASLQYITRLITSRELQRRANIVVDVDGYKRRRMSKLHDLARRMADQAVRQQRTVTLEPMPPYERRIVHLALRDREDVTTESVGEGQSRKVTIIPR
jgi:spoIIIJ-associated protein